MWNFDGLYGAEEKCRDAQFHWRWLEGFECPACGGVAHCELERRGLWQCNACLPVLVTTPAAPANVSRPRCPAAGLHVASQSRLASLKFAV